MIIVIIFATETAREYPRNLATRHYKVSCLTDWFSREVQGTPKRRREQETILNW